MHPFRCFLSDYTRWIYAQRATVSQSVILTQLTACCLHVQSIFAIESDVGLEPRPFKRRLRRYRPLVASEASLGCRLHFGDNHELGGR